MTTTMPSPVRPAEDDDAMLARVRDDIRTDRAHLNHAGMSLVPAPVLDRMHAFLDLEAEIGGYEAALTVTDELAAVPVHLARLLGAHACEVSATESATRAWEMVLWALAETRGFGSGDRVVVDQFSYATMYTTLASLHRARGVEITMVASGVTGAVDLEALDRAVDHRTRIALVTHVPTHLGTVSDAVAIGRLLADRDVVFALDVSQSLGQFPVDVEAIGCDVAFAPGRKFLRAPRGTGVLYVRSPVAEGLCPLALPIGSVAAGDPASIALPEAARRFDQFEYPVAVRLGLGAAARYAHEVGLDRIGRLVAENSRRVIDLLRSIDGVRLTGTPEDRGIISFVHETLEPAVVQAAIAAAGVNVWVNPAGGAPLDHVRRPVLPSVRVSPHYLTDDDDLDRLEKALGSLPT